MLLLRLRFRVSSSPCTSPWRTRQGNLVKRVLAKGVEGQKSETVQRRLIETHLILEPPLSINHFHLWHVPLLLSELMLVQLAVATLAQEARSSQKPGSLTPWIAQPQLAPTAGLCYRDLCVRAVSLFLLTLRNAGGFTLPCLPLFPCNVYLYASDTFNLLAAVLFYLAAKAGPCEYCRNMGMLVSTCQ